jgi:hypothetical protein
MGSSNRVQYTTEMRVLVLFHGAWDHDWLEALRVAGEHRIFCEGYELLSARGLLRALSEHAGRFADRLVRRYAGRIDAVWSADDSYGCLLAAVVARRLGLPGADPAVVVRAQHKLLQRRALAAALPQHSVPVMALPFRLTDGRAHDAAAIEAAVQAAGMRWPLFGKPARAAFSVMARRVDDARALAAHLRLPGIDRWVLRFFSRPFSQLARGITPLPCPPDTPLLEELVHGVQLNVDGYVRAGEVHVLGVVDEWMYPGRVAGARHFAGFSLPSRQSADVVQRASELAARVVRALCFDHGFFNVELFVLPDGSMRVIELNPRLAGQFVRMYAAVLGLDLPRMALALAAGRDPGAVPRLAPRAGAAASFVFRTFDPANVPAAVPSGVTWLGERHPDARLWLEPCSASARRREFRWLGSHRYAVLDHAAADHVALVAEGATIAAQLFGVASPLPDPAASAS